MRLMDKIRAKRYFGRVYLWVTSAIILLVAIFSSVIYYNTGNMVQENIYETNKKILTQIENNIALMDESIKSTGQYLYIYGDIQTVMYSHEPDLADTIVIMDKLRKSVISTNPYIHSFYVYNKYTKTFYSTYKSLLFTDNSLKEVLESYMATPDRTIPDMVPIHRKIEAVNGEKGKDEDVFTYFVYDRPIENGELNEMVVVNVKFNRLLDSINKINMTDSSSRDQIYIVSEKGEFISEKQDSEDKFEKSLKEFYEKKKAEIDYRNEKTGFYAANIDGGDYIVTYLYVETADLLLLKTQPSNKVFEYINKLKSTIIIITVIFLILTFVISISVTKGIYKPVGRLVNQVRSGNSQNTDASDLRDEISFLDRVYRNTTSRLSLYENERHSYKPILRVYWLKKLLLDSTSVGEEDFDKARQEHRISVTNDSGFVVCVIRVDNFRSFEQKLSIKDRDITKFAIINIASEIISEFFVCDGVDIHEDHIALVMNAENSEEYFYDKMTELLSLAQNYIQKYFNISVSASISEMTKGIGGLTAIYSNALRNSAYRFVLGKKSIITPGMVKKNLDNKHLDLSFSLEKKLVEAIKSGNTDGTEESFDKILDRIQELNYNNIIISLVHLLDTVRNTLEEINKSRIEPPAFNLESISQNLFYMETIDEFREKTLELLREYFQKKPGDTFTNSKHTVLVETVQDIIRNNYHDNDLCLSRIAEMTKMSAKHLGRIFKERTQMSIPGYINEVRMERAAMLLELSDLTVNEIALKVGIANETYFYSVFKKKFGSTPKEYTLKKALNKADDQKTE